jgi:hypothetical protein
MASINLSAADDWSSRRRHGYIDVTTTFHRHRNTGSDPDPNAIVNA